MKLKEIAILLNGELCGDGDIDITMVNTIDKAMPGEISFVNSDKYKSFLDSTKAAAVIVPKDFEEVSIPHIKIDNPRFVIAKVLDVLYTKERVFEGISKQAYVDPSAKIGKDVTVFPFVFIGPNARIEDGVILYSFSYVGADVAIGAGSIIYPNVTLLDTIRLGKRNIIHSGVVVGADGFGYEEVDGKRIKIPQVGTVELGDDIEIGANSTVDRATLNSTVIKNGTKIDNLVQVAHNVEVGENCVLVAQSGIAGSAKVGNNVMLLAKSAISDHTEIVDNVIIGPCSAVPWSLTEAGAYLGVPARPHTVGKRIALSLPKIPDMVKRMKVLEAKVKELESKYAE